MSKTYEGLYEGSFFDYNNFLETRKERRKKPVVLLIYNFDVLSRDLFK